MAIEDFTGYTKVDEDGDITVTSSKCAVNTERNDAISYVKKSHGVDHFGDFEHLMKLVWSAGAAGGWLNCYALTDGANTEKEMQDNTDGIELGLYSTGLSAHHIYLYDYETAHGDLTDDLSLTYTCWNTIKRDGTAFTVKIYSDSSRTTLEDTLTIVSNEEAYEYVFPVMGRGAIGTDYPETTFDSEDLDLQEAGVEHTHNASDTMAISDSLAAAMTFNVALQDTHAIGDSLATPVMEFGHAADDTLAMSDALTSAAMQFNVALDDTLVISDSLDALKILHHSASDTLTISDALEAAMTFNIALDDNLSLSDALTSAVMTFRVALADTLGISDSLAVAATYAVALADTMNISDSLAAAAVYNVALADTLEISDSVLAGWVLYVSLSDTLEMSDNLSVELIEGIIKKIRRGHIHGLKPARVVKAGRIGM